MSRQLLAFTASILLLLVPLGCGGPTAPETIPAPDAVSSPDGNSGTASPTAPASSPSGGPTQPPAQTPAATAAVPLIARKLLFGNPDKASARLSPDGARISFLAPSDGVLNVWVGSVDDPAGAKAVTSDKVRGIRSYFWSYTSQHLLYIQDANGDEDWHVYCVDLDSGQTTDLTPLEGITAQVEGLSDRFPEELLIGINDRDPQYHDIYRINMVTGDRTLLEKNERFAGYVVDDDFQVRLAMTMTPDGGNQYFESNGQGGWRDFLKIPMEDTLTTSPLAFDKTGQQLFFVDSRGRNTGALTQMDLSTRETRLIAQSKLADVGSVMIHPSEKTLQAVAFTYERTKWQVLDPAVEDDLNHLEKLADGELRIASRTHDDRKWIVAYLMDDGPVRYYLYDRASRDAKFLFTNRKALESLPLVKMHSMVLTARDGMKLVSYLSLPKGSDTDGDARPSKPLPMVLLVHGGPWARDRWGFNSQHQLLANRGYAVLSVNFRASTGFGKDFLNAGNKQWAASMQDDLNDAVDWAIGEKIAVPDKIAIMGGSYGGYATLVGLTFSPERFACGVDIVGPSNLLTLLKTIPPYWAPMLQMFKDRVGDPETDEGRKLLESRSPLNFVERIERPLLIGQGANDPRVKQSEADQIVQAMQQKNIPVTYVLFPDEGHGFARPENSLAFNSVTEAFLAKHLGGRSEPVGDAFAGSKITIPAGSQSLLDVAGALEQHDAAAAPADAPAAP